MRYIPGDVISLNPDYEKQYRVPPGKKYLILGIYTGAIAFNYYLASYSNGIERFIFIADRGVESKCIL